MKLRIITPKKGETVIEASKVFFPGTEGSFEVLRGHAPMIAALSSGVIRWDDDSSNTFAITSGFVEVKEDILTVVAQQ